MFPQDIKILKIKSFFDRRGELSVIYESEEREVVALKRSQSKQYVFRGMHYQLEPFLQKKVIQVLSGTIVDVVVNMDVNSGDYGKIFERVIHAADEEVFYIPGNYAHGFLALTDVEFQYVTLGKYSPEAELSFSLPEDYFQSRSLAFRSLILSDKDASAIPYEEYFGNRIG
jgi:dTDP-4-dehydrorhamnose 3,5-epimerase